MRAFDVINMVFKPLGGINICLAPLEVKFWKCQWILIVQVLNILYLHKCQVKCIFLSGSKFIGNTLCSAFLI